MTNSGRSRFTYSLRPIFLFVALMSMWLAFQGYLVRQRRVNRIAIEASGGEFLTGGLIGPYDPVQLGDPSYQLSWLRLQFGDEDAHIIFYNRTIDARDVELCKCFPEADVIRLVPLVEEQADAIPSAFKK